MSLKKVAIFGGSFNPIHIGHLIVADQALQVFNLDQIRWIPSGDPPHKGTLVDKYHRLEMVKLGTQGHPQFLVDDCEVRSPAISYTYNTVERLLQEEEADFYFLMGEDSLMTFETWHRYRKLLCKIPYIVFRRPGGPSGFQEKLAYFRDLGAQIHVLDEYLLDVSASSIRQQLAQGLRPNYLLRPEVLAYIEEENLYRDGRDA